MTLHVLKHGPYRRRIVVLMTTITCLLTVDILVRRAKPRLDPFYIDRYRRKLSAAASAKPDILLIGSSRLKYALAPEVIQQAIGLRAFNYGIPAAKVIEWQWMALEGIERVRPRLVVLGVNASAIRADYLPVPAARNLFTLPDFLAYCRSDGWSGTIAEHFLDRRVMSVWALSHRRFEVKMLIQRQLGCILPKYAQAALEREAWIGKPCPPDGYEHPWLYGRRLKTLGQSLDEDPGSIMKANVPAFSANATAITHFEELLDWFNEQRVPLLVAYLPNSPVAEERWADVEPSMEQVLATACQVRNIPFLSCNRQDIPRTNYDYLDELHAGLPLARRITRRIADHIVQLGLIDEMRSQVAVTAESDATTP
ncbi:MAG: hypothetical protein ACE5EQ_08255 [Phycisphaerae bacterium]